MAIWQFTFYLVPCEAVDQIHGPGDRNTTDAIAEAPNYWTKRSPRCYAADAARLLPLRKSWSLDALMFGDEKGDTIELWDDGITVRLDVRQFNEPLVRAILNFAATNYLNLVTAQTGRFLRPNFDELTQEITHSSAMSFVLNPHDALRKIGREIK